MVQLQLGSGASAAVPNSLQGSLIKEAVLAELGFNSRFTVAE